MNDQNDIDIMPTPNPNAIKLILASDVKKEGYSNYQGPEDCGENKLAESLFEVRGIDQLHFFENIITVTKFGYLPWNEIESQLKEVITKYFPSHNSDYYDPDPELERRQNLSPELLEIETILDKTIRPGLQGDGGDLRTLSYENNILLIQYQGACGTCPSSTTGTLEAIKGILRDEYNPEIDVFIAPPEY